MWGGSLVVFAMEWSLFSTYLEVMCVGVGGGSHVALPMERLSLCSA